MAVSATDITASSFCFSGIYHRKINQRKKLLCITNYIFENPIPLSTTRTERSFVVQALEPQGERSKEVEENSSIKTSTDPFTSQEDLGYLAKLVAGSIAGAAAIKYGSAIFPEITKPNIAQALVMISAPVVVAIFLLIRESSKATEE